MKLVIDEYGCIILHNKNIDAKKFGNIINFLINNSEFVDTLDLKDNILGDGDDTVEMIKLFFESNKSIKFIDMSNNKFGPNVAKAFIEILSKYKLGIIYFSKNEFSDENQKRIQEACSYCISVSDSNFDSVSISASASASITDVCFI